MNLRFLVWAGGFVLLVASGTSHRAAEVDRQIPYEQKQSCYAGGLSQCDAYFAQVPARRRLVVEQATTTVETGTALKSVKFYGSRIQDLPLKLKSVSGSGNKVYSGTQPLLAYFNGGESPNFAVRIAAGKAEFSSATMTIKGYLMDDVQP